MNDVIVVLGFFSVLSFTILELRTIRVDRLGFSDGILIGAVYYVVIPLSVVLLTGELRDLNLHVPAYDPYADFATTLNLLLGLAVVLALHVIARMLPRRRLSPRSIEVERFSFRMFLSILLGLEVANFFISGKSSGGHWADNAAAAFSQNPIAVFSLGIQNCLRTSAFGYLIYRVVCGDMSRFSAALLGAVVVTVDVALTFNRITVAYFIMMIAVLYRHRLALLAMGLAVLAPTVTYASSVWAVFRGMALSRGVSIENILLALQTATAAQNGEGGVSKTLNAFAEASNILVFKFLVENVPDHFSPLWGQTFLLKSFSFFIPASIWEDKPKTFGVYLGYYVESIQGLALNSTLFGEAYGNFYTFWPFALLLMLLLFELLFRSVARLSPSYAFFGAFIGIALWRFDMTFAFISMVGIGSLHISTKIGRLLISRGGRAYPMFPAASAKKMQSRPGEGC
ncbi:MULTISPECIES: hypothetical protein [unclassified Bradyrhizobium]|uniref:hypothetical protein n=1 Tax=unclassified Bradyrhizobium TaxID=2631580 RepID=UPI00211E132A|nr:MULTISPECIES: hypothetical protein [unclassified Bradyrhizobium]MDD1532485.1 hypothetical protein [Bradyrhizobium sp. WBOS8]MDD1582489.1 hypothetical protein [Bradyrhizobium sp. WBOS4]UUO50868.1 hypothetical protein DCM78_30575 [Bradyrhizobium sp. WBOS04]UUO58247.1 hypothetical protein DCM80_03075 [Bradyrhizobium sp. WBOS08]